MSRELNEEELLDLYAWIDRIPLARPKRHITRDFSDGVMAAEIVKYFFPKLVDLHNYIPANSTPQKLSNWSLLNRKVFSKLNFHLPEDTVNRIALSTAGVIEPVLSALREKIDKKLEQTADNILDFEYFDPRKHHERPPAEIRQTEAAQLRGEEMKKDDKRRPRNGNPQHTAQFDTDMDPRFRIILQEKEQTVIALQETVEILQMKMSRLEHLVHLKDMRIEELTRHLETYKGKGNPR
ncbi:sperm flagellar protein 1 [Hippoglossus stenolepis]|uniref:sperm flagellar protein 1 n=1 Tax=Hippoglossus stenolepis TaxID=195615 RepID=UPI001FAF2FA0|nr:sperm flagellar protein 1 [Hippoglossus stenolepis]